MRAQARREAERLAWPAVGTGTWSCCTASSPTARPRDGVGPFARAPGADDGRHGGSSTRSGPCPAARTGGARTTTAARLAVVCRAQDDPAVPRSPRATWRSSSTRMSRRAVSCAPRLRHRRREDPSSDDANGHALGLAVAAARGPEPLRWMAADLFTRAAAQRSAHPRATAHAAVAAAEFLAAYPEAGGRRVLVDAARTLAPFLAPSQAAGLSALALAASPRLTYANALIPEALVAIGAALGEADILARGLRLLSWLARRGRRWRAASVSSPTGGRGPADARPAFDQQPVEASSFAEAFARAFDVTGDPAWLAGLARAAGMDPRRQRQRRAPGGRRDGRRLRRAHAGGRESRRGRRVDDRRTTTLQQAHRLLPAFSGRR